MKLNYIIIPLFTILVAVVGSLIAEEGIHDWYKTLKKPAFTPENKFFGQIWTGIFILCTISGLIVWNSNAIAHDDPFFILIFGTFMVNAIFNIFWNYLFFGLHMIGLSVWELAALALSTLTLILYIYPVSVLAAWLLVPYFIWVCFATYLNYSIWELNK